MLKYNCNDFPSSTTLYVYKDLPFTCSTAAITPDRRTLGRKYHRRKRRSIERSLRCATSATSRTFEAEGVQNGSLKTELIVILTVIFGIIIVDMNL